MASEQSIRIERLDGRHDRRGFDCGNQDLNGYLRRFAGQNARKGLSVTYVAVGAGTDAILGFYSISSGQVICESLPEAERNGLPGYQIPIVRIWRLATELEAQGEGIGELLLIDALQRALVISDELGVYAIEVKAKSSKARSFYTRYGSLALLDDDLHLYISLATVRKLFDVSPGAERK